jgi:Rad3-related DNA helicase
VCVYLLVELSAVVPDGMACFFVSYEYMEVMIDAWHAQVSPCVCVCVWVGVIGNLLVELSTVVPDGMACFLVSYKHMEVMN